METEIAPDETAGRGNVQGPTGFPDHFLVPEVLDYKGHALNLDPGQTPSNVVKIQIMTVQKSGLNPGASKLTLSTSYWNSGLKCDARPKRIPDGRPQAIWQFCLQKFPINHINADEQHLAYSVLHKMGRGELGNGNGQSKRRQEITSWRDLYCPL